MNVWTFILILVLIVIVAFIICLIYKTLVTKEPELVAKIYEGAAELANDSCGCNGGREDITDKIITLLRPYIKEKGTKHLEQYLLNYYNYSGAHTRIIKEESIARPFQRSGLDIPKSIRFLHALIEDIVREHNIKTKDEFLEKSKITYSSFLPITQKNLLCNQEKYDYSSSDIKKIANILDIFLTKEDLILQRQKIRKLADKFAIYNKLFKFKKDKLKWSTSKLKSTLKKEPNKVLEVDLIGLRPALKGFAKKQAQRKIDKHLINRIRKYMSISEIPDKYKVDLTRVKSLEDLVELLEREVVRLRRPQIRTRDLELEIERRRRLQAEEQAQKERLEKQKEKEAKEKEKEAKQKEEERRRRAEAREAQLEHERLVRQEQERAERERVERAQEQAEKEQAEKEQEQIKKEQIMPPMVEPEEKQEEEEIELIRPPKEEPLAEIEEIEEPPIVEKEITGLAE